MSTIVIEVGEAKKPAETPPPAAPAPEKSKSRYDFWTPGIKTQAEPNPAAEKPVAEPTPTLEPQPEQKEKLPTLDEARAAYAKAHREYREANKRSIASMLNIGGDTSAISEARAAYDAALKAATHAEREKLTAESEDIMESKDKDPLKWRSSENINRALFDKFVVDEERKMAGLKISEMPEQKQGMLKKAWTAYARLKPWQKIALSTAIGTGAFAASGVVAGSAILYYAGRRIVVSAGAIKAAPVIMKGIGAVTTLGYEAYDRTLGRKNTKEYQIGSLLAKREGEIAECLDDMRLKYGDILGKEADREKKRMYLKIAIAAAVGVGAAGLAAHYVPSGGGGVEHHVPTGGKPLVPGHATPDHPSGAHPAETPSAPKTVDHPANAPAHPAETPPPSPKVPEQHASAPAPAAVSVEHPPIEVHKGDSLWEITAKELQKDPAFDKLNDAQKTWMISDIVDRAEAHKAALGIANPDALAVGEKIDLSSVLKSGDIHSLVEKAGHLTAAQQEHILANNHEISAWLHAHPHEQLTGARVNEILHGHTPDHPEITTVQPPDVDNAIPLQHLENFKLAPQHVQVGNIAEQIHRMPYNPEHGQQLLERIDSMDRIPPPEMRQLFLVAAERVGDHHPMFVDMNNVMEVHRRMRDYLVSYPRARDFGFHSYDHWARVRDVPVHRFAEDTMISPRPEAMQSALRHSFFHRGASVHEMQGDALRRVPLEERHANLGRAIRGNSDLVRRAPATTTVGDFVATHHGAIGRK